MPRSVLCLPPLLIILGLPAVSSGMIESNRTEPSDVAISRFLSATDNTQPLVPALPHQSGGFFEPFASPYTGNLFLSDRLLAVPAIGPDWDLRISYNSLLASELTAVGRGWRLSYDISLSVGLPDSNSITVNWGDGRRDVFVRNGLVWISDPSLEGRVIKGGRSDYSLHTKRGFIYLFDLSGRLTGLRDRNFNQMAFAYDPQERLETITDASGRSVNLAYDAQGRLVSISGLSSQPIQFQYDASDRLVAVVDPLPGGFPGSFTYDASGRVASFTDPDGRTMTFEYYGHSGDPFAHVVKRVRAANAVRTFEYDAPNRRTTVRDSIGPGEESRTSYVFDANGLCTSVVDGPLGTTEVVYDPSTRKVTSYTDADGHTTLATHDALGNLLTLTDAAANQASWVYDATHNLVTSHTDWRGKTWTIQRDSEGNPTVYTNPVGNQTRLTYGLHGLVASQQDPAGNITNYAYDADGNLVGVTDPAGFSTALAYNGRGELVSIVDAGSNTWTIVRNGRGEATSLGLPGGGQHAVVWTGSGRPASLQDPIGGTTTYEYDALDRVVRTVDPLGGERFLTRNGAGHVIQLRDEMSRTMTFTVDPVGRMLSRTDPDGGTWAFNHGFCDFLSATDALGVTTTNQYDALHRLVTRTTGVVQRSYGYDANSNLVSARLENPPRPVISYNIGRDDAGRVVSLEAPHLARTTTIALSSLGLPFSVSDNIRPAGQVAYEYDVRGLLTTVFVPGSTYKASMTYDARGLLTGIAYIPGGPNAGYSYDANSWLSSIANQGTGFLAQYDLTRNPRGDLTQISGTTPATGPVTHDFAFDILGQLTQETYNGSATGYRYDPVGSRTQALLPAGTDSYTYSTGHRLVSVSGVNGITRQWNANGACVLDVNGGLTTSFSYRPDGELQSIIRSGRVTTIDIGPFGEVAHVEYPDSTSRWYAYDWCDAGALRRVTLSEQPFQSIEELASVPYLGRAAIDDLRSFPAQMKLDAPFGPGDKSAVLIGPFGPAQVAPPNSLLADRYFDAFGNVLGQVGGPQPSQSYRRMEDLRVDGFLFTNETGALRDDWPVMEIRPRPTAPRRLVAESANFPIRIPDTYMYGCGPAGGCDRLDLGGFDYPDMVCSLTPHSPGTGSVIRDCSFGHDGVLPRPKKELVGRRVEYYIEAAARDLCTGTSVDMPLVRGLLLPRGSPGNLPTTFGLGASGISLAAIVTIGGGAASGGAVAVTAPDWDDGY